MHYFLLLTLTGSILQRVDPAKTSATPIVSIYYRDEK